MHLLCVSQDVCTLRLVSVWRQSRVCVVGFVLVRLARAGPGLEQPKGPVQVTSTTLGFGPMRI